MGTGSRPSGRGEPSEEPFVTGNTVNGFSPTAVT
jgi:hypothetical protein